MTTILVGAASSIAGFSSLAFDVPKMQSILHLCEHDGTEYGLGCKPDPLAASPPVFVDEMGSFGGGTINRCDCSALHRYLAFHCAGVEIPDGSINQNDWYAQNGFKHHAIAEGEDYTQNLAPNVLYACFCRTGTRGETIGHTWLGLAGWSYESSGGVGPHSRP